MARMDTEALSTQLWLLTLKRSSTETAAWFASFPDMLSASDFAAAFEEIGGRLGEEPVRLSPAEAAALRRAGSEHVPGDWTLEDLGRAALLTSAAGELPASDYLLLLAQCAAKGERGRSSVMRAMTLLPSALPVN